MHYTSKIIKIVRRHSYTGTHYYNANGREPNPERPLLDITAEVKRTLIRPKPREEWAEYNVPALVDEATWQKVNASITERGRGRGKQGKSIEALLRNRLYCPQCGRPMVVRRDGRHGDIYYHCSRYFQPWTDKPCSFRRFIPALSWDNLIWGDICSWLRSDTWVEKQLESEQQQDENIEKMIKMADWKIAQIKAKIGRVQQGYDGGIYSLEEAKKKLAEYNKSIGVNADEKKRLQEKMAYSLAPTDREATKRALESLRDKNLDEATFLEKADVIAKLGIKVYPAEDLKTMKVIAKINISSAPKLNHLPPSGKEIESKNKEHEPQVSCRKLRLVELRGFELL